MQPTLQAKILKKTMLSQKVVGLTLTCDKGQLPAWTPGAHIELALLQKDGEPLYRQYSLCGDLNDQSHWQIAVLKDDSGRGGSRFIHEVLKEGEMITVSQPKNHFPFSGGAKCFFIAGGIGITPIVPMVKAAAEANLDWKLLYLARTEADFIFLDELKQYSDHCIQAHASESDGIFDLKQLLSDFDDQTTVYSCGPQGLLDALESHQQEQKHLGWKLVLERFNVQVDEQMLKGKAFTVTLHKSGKQISVQSDETILSALKREGIRVKCSCQNGTCGTCETVVISGTPEHRDFVLSPEERELNETMMVCVSRALSDELVLDL